MSFKCVSGKSADMNSKKKKGPIFEISKCENQMANEIIKTMVPVQTLPNQYGDRFIPRRYNATKSAALEAHALLHMRIYGDQASGTDKTSSSDVSVDIFDMKDIPGYWRSHAFKVSIEQCFGISDKNTILNFHDWITKEVCYQTLNMMPKAPKITLQYPNLERLDWPCVPRSRPLVFTDSTHDLPEFMDYSHLRIIAWSKTGKIAASFGRDLVLWYPDNEGTVVYKISGIRSLAYNIEGNLLAVGVRRYSFTELQIWDIKDKSMYITNYCHYEKAARDEIRVIEWDPLGKYIVCGMTSGSVVIHHISDLSILVTLENACCSCIIDLKFSINRKYLAASNCDDSVYVWSWQNFETILEYRGGSDCLLAWHPWKEKYLIIAATCPADIILIDVQSHELLAYYIRNKDWTRRIDSLTFSRLSGELVVAFTILKDNEESVTEILVMASMNRIVDTLLTHKKNVRFLMWNPDGTQLATAGDDETLNIWNFFALSKNMFAKKAKLLGNKKKYSYNILSLNNSPYIR